MKICIYEDSHITGLYPVNILRHTSEIICGAFSLKQKFEKLLAGNSHLSFTCRKSLAPLFKERFPQIRINNITDDNYLFLNSRVIFTKSFIEGILLTEQELMNSIILQGKETVAFLIPKDNIQKLKSSLSTGEGLISISTLSKIMTKHIQLSELNNDETEEQKILHSPADLINCLNEELRNDLFHLFSKKNLNKIKRYHCELVNPSKIFIEKDCNINRQVVIDASKGPVYISKGTIIEPFSFIQGPVYIGENCVIRPGSAIYGPTSISSFCKLSGEIVASILHPYVNKQHLGFLGHSYICEWVNLGAGTTTSNLKNNYSKITLNYPNKKIDSGTIFLGSIIGDHTKTGISTMLNTGSIIGISSNLFGSGYHKKFINSFSWVDAAGKTSRYQLDKALETSRISMKRRNINMSKSYENLIRFSYSNLKQN